MSGILVVGFISIDFIGHVDTLPTLQQPAKAGEFDVACGGRAANQAMALTAVEAEVSLIARLGHDQHAEMLEEELVDLGVGIDTVDHAPDNTGLRLIAELPDGQQTAVVYRGANDYLSVDDLNRRVDSFAGASAVGMTTEPMGAVVLRGLELARQTGARSVLTYNPGLPLSDRVLAAADVVVVSDATCAGLLDADLASTKPEHAARALIQRGAPAVVLLSGRRAVLATADDVRALDAPGDLAREDAVDAFAAGLLHGFSLGEALEQSVMRGVRVSCLLVD